jgi:2'-5' RNA ligase
MARLFVALIIPDELGPLLTAVRPTGLAGVELVEPDQMHVTLHFIGDAEFARAERIRQSLSGLRFDPFALTVRGVGQFPPDESAKCLWAGLQPDPALTALHRDIGVALAPTGFTPETRPYHPHITLAWVRAFVPPGVIASYLQRHRDVEIATLTVTRFALYSSDPSSTGSHYSIVQSFPSAFDPAEWEPDDS